MTNNTSLALTFAAMIFFIFLVALINFAGGVAEVGSCGVGPAAPRDCSAALTR